MLRPTPAPGARTGRARTAAGGGLALALGLALAGCTTTADGTAVPAPPTVTTAAPGAAAAPSSTAPSSTTPSSTASSTTAAPSQDLAAVALGPGDVPARFAPQDVSAQEALEQIESLPAGAVVTPEGCEGVTALTPDTVDAGYFATFADLATREVVGEFLAPAGTPSIADLRDEATRCADATVEVPDLGVSVRSTITLVPTPPAAADATLGLRSTVVTTTAGSPAVTVEQTLYAAEANGVLLALTASGGPSGRPIDAAVVDPLFTTAVERTAR